MRAVPVPFLAVCVALACQAHPPSARRSVPASAPGTASASAPGSARAGTPALPALTVRPGFRVDRVYSVPFETQGSWVSLTVDDRGRLLASAQHRRGLFRITPGATEAETRVEALAVDVGQAHGLAFAGGSLYVVTSEAKAENGVYRARDTDGDDRFDQVTKLLALGGNGEHGPHAIVAGPDGQSLYVIGGNFAPMPAGIGRARVPRGWGDDHLIPPLKDPAGNERAPLPGGWVIRFDHDGKGLELVASGLRNAYDLAFDQDGELFTYDSDMEWDLGTFWYRPPRVCHIPSGVDFGWRISTRPWPAYWADSLPPVIETGPASPTGVVFGRGARFPAKYQRALFALDWTYGAIYAVHLAPKGGTFGATFEELVTGKPLPVTDAVVGKDGALYFITGGRTLPTALYRLTYTGDEPTAPAAPARDATADALRAERRRLEAFHGVVDPAAVAAALPLLGHEDRFLRHAARVALEHQPPAAWHARALALREPRALITAAVALARTGAQALARTGAPSRARLVAALARIDAGALGVEWKLDLLRAHALVFSRLGAPQPAERQRVLRQLEPLYPAGDERVDAELARVLAFLQSPAVVAKTVALMADARGDDATGLAAIAARNEFYGAAVKGMVQRSPLRARMHLAAMLRGVRAGWTPELRRQYFTLINRAMGASSGGNVYYGAWQAIRDDAEAQLPPDERKRLAGVLAPVPLPSAELPAAKGPGKVWTVNAVLEALDANPGLMSRRDLENGKKMFSAAACVLCHRFGGEGNAVGPDLTGVSGRYGLRELMEAIVQPSAVISDQYEAVTVTKKDGSTVGGRVVSQDDRQVVLMTNMYAPQELTVVNRPEIASVESSPVSQMPAGLLNALNRDEVLDLVAYLLRATR